MIIQDDCLKAMDNLIAENIKVDAIITDPPYGTVACKWDTVIPFEPMWERLNRLIKPHRTIVLFGMEPFSSALRMSNIKQYKYDWIWEKENFTNFFQAKFRPLCKYENIMVFGDFGTNTGCRYKPTYYPQGIKHINKMCINGKNVNGMIGQAHRTTASLGREYRQTVTNYPDMKLKFNRDKAVHPTQKPVALMEYLIKTYTKENETVLDFTMGSGTTGVACLNTGRNFIGIEKNKEYFDKAKERMAID